MRTRWTTATAVVMSMAIWMAPEGRCGEHSGGEAAPPVKLFPIVKDGKWGYMDEKGVVKIEPQYDAAFDFSEGLACVVRYPWRGYIDGTGRIVIEPQFTWAGPFREGLAPVLKHRDFYGRHPNYYRGTGHTLAPDVKSEVKQSGLIDSSGKLKPGVPFTTSGVSEGKVLLSSRKTTEVYGVDGKKCEHDAEQVCQFSDGLAAARKGNLWGYLDHSMKWVIPPSFDDADGFFEGLAAVGKKTSAPAPQGGRPGRPQKPETGGKTTWGFIDKTGKQVIAFQFEDTWRFSEGLASVKVGGKWGYIDKTGATVIQPAYDYAWPFSEGMGRVMVGTKQGFIDKTGKLVIEPKYQPAWEFSNGLARVQIKDADGFREGYINKQGEYVWEPTK